MPDRSTPRDRSTPTVVLCIPTFGVGGAERQLVQLARGLDPSRWRVVLVTFDKTGPPAEAAAITHVSIVERGPARVAALRRLLSVERAEVLQAYLVGAQMYGMLAKALLPDVKLIAAVRSSVGVRDIEGWKGKVSHAAVFAFQDVIDRYVFNSATADQTVGRSIPSYKRVVIFNGTDTARFRPDPDARLRLRDELGLSRNCRIIGSVANVSIYKGYETMIRAAVGVLRKTPDVHFVAVGQNRNPLGTRMQALADEMGLSGRWHFVGPRPDVEDVVPAFDLLCSASWTEGFPNSIAEAMASGVPCVVTDVGDSAALVGDTGVVVPPRDHEALADGIINLLSEEQVVFDALRDAARRRVMEKFSLERMVASYERLYEALLQRERCNGT